MLTQIETGKVMRRQVRNQNQKLVVKVFSIEEIISQGEDWVVLHVVDQDTMHSCTLKVIEKQEKISKERKDQIFSQIQNQRKMSGRQHFIDLLQVYQDSSTVYLLMERWGTPLEKVMDRRHTLMEREAQLVFCQLVDILQSLRSQNITHGNINLHSVLLSQGQPNQLQLTNFSNSEDLTHLEPTTTKSFIKSSVSENHFHSKSNIDLSQSNIDIQEPEFGRNKCGMYEFSQYTSPEEYHHERESSKRGLSQRDIWSCGVLLFRLLTGVFPFATETGKLAPNKIKNATFSFPQLTPWLPNSSLQVAFPQLFCSDFISSAWKQLLKKMIAFQAQRIPVKELINHPLKQHYFELKSEMPDLRISQPHLQHLFSKKEENRGALYNRAWEVNFGDEVESSDEEEDAKSEETIVQCRISFDLGQSKENVNSKHRLVRKDSEMSSKNEEGNKETSNVKQSKMFRIHKTQYLNSAQPPQYPNRHETAALTINQKNTKEREKSCNQPFTIKTNETISDKGNLVAKQPSFITKFKWFKKEQFLGYIYSDTIGVVFGDGQHIIGHNRQEYRYVEEIQQQIDSEILIDNPGGFNKKEGPSFKKSIYRHQPRLTPNQSIYLINPDDGRRSSKKALHFKSQQVSTHDLNKPRTPYQLKFTHSQLVQASEKSGVLTQQKLRVYEKALEYFGDRVVKSKLDVWVDKFWRDGNIFIFLLSNGCWQVAFREYRSFRIYAIDENEIGWAQNMSQSPDILFKVRQIIDKYRSKAIKSKQIKNQA